MDVVREIYSQRKNDKSIRIDMISRNGILPRVRSTLKLDKFSDNILASTLKYRNLSLNETIDILGKEISQERTKRVLKSIERSHINSYLEKWRNDPFKLLGRDLRDVNDTRKDNPLSALQSVYVSNSDTFVKAFHQFSEQEQSEYKKAYQTIHLSHLAPMPPESAKILQDLFTNGQLSIIRVDGSSSLDMSGDKPLLNHAGETREYDLVIDSTGQKFDVSTNKTPLFESMKRSGLITRNGDGACARNQDCESVGSDGECKNLYMLGVATVTYGSARFSRVVKEGFACGKMLSKKLLMKHYHTESGAKKIVSRL